MAKPIIGVTAYTSEGPFGVTRSCIGQDYITAVVAAGGIPVGIPVGLDEESLQQIRDMIDGLLVPGGVDIDPARYGQERHPQLGAVEEERDALELPLAHDALESDLPFLGICRGIQVMAVAAGGTLYQDLPAQLGEVLPHAVMNEGKDSLVHSVEVSPESRLARATGRTELQVNSRHHQAVQDLPPGFIITARAPDGVIEAIEKPGHPFAIGVQCHPENTWATTAPDFGGLFRAFVAAAGQRRSERVRT